MLRSRERYSADPHAVDHVGQPATSGNHLDDIAPVRSAQPQS